ncbi:MAG: gliding motility-associated C-terminal domain-containing protein [Chitinophagaceae bacterium]|nr:gliding motility-associated C-terminal domain-containing protein [Chitinophagaceae bacterium]
MLRLISNINSSFLKGMIVAAISFIISNEAVAQAITWQWGKTEASSLAKVGKKIVVDEFGNSYSAGTFTGTITVGASIYTSIGGSDILLVKYNAAGVRIWSKQYGSNLNDDVNSLQYDKAGYLYLNGTFYGASFQYGSGSIPNTTSGNLEVYLLRIDASGNVKWGFHPQGNGQDYAGNVYSDGASVIITGNFQSPSIQFGAVSMVNASFRSMFLARLDSTGVVLWAKQFGNGYIDAGNGVSMDNSGAIFVTGNLGSPSLTLGSTTLTRLGAGGTFDIFIAKFDGSGNPIWAKSAAGTGTEEPIDLVTDEKGNSYISGYFKSTSINFSGTTLSNPSALEQFFMARYDSNGNLKWVKKSITDVQSRGLDISLASENKIFAVGYYSGGAMNFNGVLAISGSNDGFIVQYDSLGNVSWSDKAGGTGDDKAAGVSGTSCGGVITGEFNSPTLQFGTISIPNASSGTFDFFTSRFGTTFSYNLPVDTLRACGTTALLDAGAGYASYAWNTLDLTQQITADVSGRYVVTVFNQDGCVASDSVYVSIVTTNILQQDTIICKGNPVHLSIDSAWMKGKLFHSFTKNMNSAWNVAVTTIPDARYRMVVSGTWTPSIWPTERLDVANVFKTADNSFVRKWQSPADLPASFTLNGTYLRPQTDVYRTDHIYDYYFSTPIGTQFNIGFNEVVLSDNSGALTFELYAINNPVTVHWSTGATTNSIDVAPTSTTTYYVTITDGISSCTDSVKLTILDAPTLILPDTLKVCGDSVELDAGAGASSYLWSTGATTQKIMAYTNGKYNVTADNALGCSRTDSVYVSLTKALIQQNDTIVCKASPITLTAQTGVGWTYLWSNNITGSTTTISPLISSKYFLTVSDGIGQCTDSIQVNVLDLPQASLPDTLKVCGTDAILDAGAGFTTYSWSNGATTQSLSVSVSGKYFVTVTNATGCSSIDSVYLSLISSGIQQNDTSICKGSSLLLSAITGTGYNYSWSTGAITSSVNIIPTVSAKYYLSVNDGIGSCVDSIMVTILALPQPLLPDSIKICGTSALLDAGSGFTSYAWSNGASSRVITASQRGTYKVIVTDANGCSNRDSSFVSLVKADILQNDTAICKGTSLTLQAFSDPAYSYSWSAGQSSSSIFVSPNAYTRYYLSTSDGYQTCQDSIQVSILSIDTSVSVAGSTTICAGGSVQLNAVAGYTYQWYRNGMLMPGAVSRILQATQTGSYKVHIFNSNGCNDSSNAYSININSLPVVSLNTLGPVTVCEGSAIALNAIVTPNAPGMVQYQWLLNGVAISGATLSTYNTNIAGSYSVNVTNSNGCSANSLPVTVIVSTKPIISLQPSGSVSFCVGGSTVLRSNVNAGNSSISSYQWYKNAVLINGAVSDTLSVSVAGQYNLVVTNGNGCSSISSSLTVTESALPIGAIIPPAVTKICRGVYAILQATGGTRYNWYLNGNLIAGSNAATLNATDAGVYSVELFNAAGCSSMGTNTVSLSVIEVPKPDFTVVTKCAGTATIFTNKTTSNPTDVVNYTWNTGDGGTYATTDAQHLYSKGGQYTVSLSATSTACPFQPIVKTIPIVIEQSRPGIAYAPVNAIEGKPTQLQARNFGVQYQWSPATGLNNKSIAAPIATNTTAQTYLVNIYTVTGCVTTDTQLVRMFKEREIYVPTAFTPNNDGKNDRLYPILAGVSQLTYFRVYNRWGNLIFETRQSGAAYGWDGTFKGQLQPTETYVWVAEGIDIDGKPVKRNGTSLLIR